MPTSPTVFNTKMLKELIENHPANLPKPGCKWTLGNGLWEVFESTDQAREIARKGNAIKLRKKKRKHKTSAWIPDPSVLPKLPDGSYYHTILETRDDGSVVIKYQRPDCDDYGPIMHADYLLDLKTGKTGLTYCEGEVWFTWKITDKGPWGHVQNFILAMEAGKVEFFFMDTMRGNPPPLIAKPRADITYDCDLFKI